MKKAIVIPSYRAEKTLPSVVPRIPTAFWDDGVAIIVNDKRPDNTGEGAEKLKSRWPGLEVVHHEVNQGYGGAQKTGLKRGLDLGASAFAVVHADGQYAPEETRNFFAIARPADRRVLSSGHILPTCPRLSSATYHRVITAPKLDR